MLFEIFKKLDLFFKDFNPSALWFSFFDIYFSFFWRFYAIKLLPTTLFQTIIAIYSLFTYFIEYANSLFYPFSFFLNEFTLSAILFSIKFLVFIALLIFVRGGIPRYRFDYLTKLGWMKFLSLILLFFLFEFLLLISF